MGKYVRKPGHKRKKNIKITSWLEWREKKIKPRRKHKRFGKHTSDGQKHLKKVANKSERLDVKKKLKNGKYEKIEKRVKTVKWDLF